MSKKRVSDRIYVQSLIEIFDKKTDLLVGHLANYSPGGLMLTGKKKIMPGTVFDCRMIIPDNMLSNGEICFKLKAAWCEDDIMPGTYTIGFQFQDISRENFRQIFNIHESLITQKL